MLISYLLQMVPPFKGKIRIGRFLIKNTAEINKPRILPLINGLKFSIPGLADSIAYEMYINGVYDKDLVNYLQNNIPAGGIFIDIGANVGSIAIAVAAKRPDIKVFAFEASPHIFSHLIKNKSLNSLNNIECINRAVHNTENEMLDFFAPKDQFGKGSFADTYTSESEQVKTMRLDRFLFDTEIYPNIIKIDVQGYELHVFEGLRNYLTGATTKPVIVFEFEAWAEKIALGEENIGKARQLIIEFGYKVVEFDTIIYKNGDAKKKIDHRKLIAYPCKTKKENEN